MCVKRIIPILYIEKGKAVAGKGGEVISESPLDLAMSYGNSGADALLFVDLSDNDLDHDQAIKLLLDICGNSQIPVLAGGKVRRLEDVKKILYAGAEKAIIDGSDKDAIELLEEAAGRFSRDRIAFSIHAFDTIFKYRDQLAAWSSELILTERLAFDSLNMLEDQTGILVCQETDKEALFGAMKLSSVSGLSGTAVSEPSFDYLAFKKECRAQGIEIQMLESAVPFSEFRLNEDGLIPVVTQDYRTGEVLMLAYMNEEAFRKTLETGKMVYYSRSRKCLWMKGETSGHFQYVKTMSVDCDKDTLLAKVAQIGAACHTGNKTCFYTPLFGMSYDEKNPLKVFEKVMEVILDRKKNPKEGSYTNYLFDKGIDKILKKVGEEASEIIIAAKNPSDDDVRYEISDLLYHLMVLMADRGISWEDVTSELARR